jgi:sugar phosphate isomerase/epimerase
MTSRDRSPTRREFLTTTSAGVAALATAASSTPAPAAASSDERSSPARGPAAPSAVKLGVASYSLRELSRADAIAGIHALRARYVSIKSFHLPYESPPAELAAGRKEFEDAGLTIVSGGVITLQQDDDRDIRTYFEYARGAGMPLMIIAPTPATLPRIERFVREYGIAVAIHNHGPEDRYFPAPRDALAVIRDMDPRVGLCVDLGHTARAGADVVEALAEAGDRLLDIHLKDLENLKDAETQCVVGEGAMPIPAIFRQLAELRYAGCVNLEYEIDAENPVPGMQRSFAYLRGVLGGLGVLEG